MKSGKASGKFCPCGVYNKGYPVKCRRCGRRFAPRDLEGQQAIDALLDADAMDPPYRPRCDECEYDGGAYLLGPVALKHALEHTKETGHKVAVYQGRAAE
jgi:hypothetical protein